MKANQKRSKGKLRISKPEVEDSRRQPDATHQEVVEVGPEDIDEYREEEIREIATRVPEVRFRHSSHFTADEDKIIAASLKTRSALYRIADTLHCDYRTLKKHIEDDKVLTMLFNERFERECEEIEEAINDLVKLHHPGVVMWKAAKLMPTKYGGEKSLEEEDDTRLVIGGIGEDQLREADAVRR